MILGKQQSSAKIYYRSMARAFVVSIGMPVNTSSKPLIKRLPLGLKRDFIVDWSHYRAEM